jgi:hypothetical protein
MKTHACCWAVLWTSALAVPALAHATDVSALVWFEPEGGRFAARTPAQRFALDATGVRTADGAELHFRGARQRQGVLDPAGIFPLTRFTSLDRAGRRSATAAQGLRFSGIYPHVDLYYHFAGGRLEYDLTLEPGARLADVRIATNQKWKLHGLGQQPVAWQSNSSGARYLVQVHYVRCGADTCFSANGYDPRLPLVIDPVIFYASYFGSSGFDFVWAMQADPAGNLYVLGHLGGFGLTTTTPAPSGFLSTNGPAFLAKFSPAGQLLYAVLPDLSYFSPLRLAVDSSGDVYLTGASVYGKTLDNPAWIQKYTNYLLIKIDAAGTDLIYQTYLPSSPTAVLPDGNGNLYLAGTFAVQPPAGAFRSASGVDAGRDSALVLLSADGTHLLSSTFLEYPADNVAALAIDAASSDVIVAGSSSATGPRQAGALQQYNAGTDMFRSLDTGATWAPTGRDVAGAAKFQDLSVPRRLWAVSGTALAVSNDFGASWQGGLTLPASGSILTVANVPDLLFLASTVGLYRSKDAGATWSPCLGHYSGRGLYAVDPQNPDNLFATDGSGGWFSKDGGQSWYSVGQGSVVNFPAFNITLVAVAGNPATFLIAGTALNGQPILVWFRFGSGPLTGGIPVSLPVADPSTPGRVLAISTANTLIESKDSGATYAQVGPLPAPAPPGFTQGLAIDPHQPNTIYSYGLLFFRSTDGGRTWTALSAAPRPGASTGNQLLVNPLNSSELLSIFGP